MGDLRRDFLRSLADGGVPLGLVAPEPEVARATIASVQCKSLARTVADLVNEHEPLLKAEADGATVTVRELGGPGVMRFTVESGR